MEHTKLPWEFIPLGCDDDRGMGYIFGADGKEISHHGVFDRWKQENLANASFIVEACNNYDRLKEINKELLEALKRAKITIREWHNINMHDNDMAWKIYDRSSPEMKIINAALAKVEAK